MKTINLKLETLNHKHNKMWFTMSPVTSFVIASFVNMALCTRNLSLHCISAGVSRCACIVTESNSSGRAQDVTNVQPVVPENLVICQITNNISRRPGCHNAIVWPNAVLFRARRLYLQSQCWTSWAPTAPFLRNYWVYIALPENQREGFVLPWTRPACLSCSSAAARRRFAYSIRLHGCERERKKKEFLLGNRGTVLDDRGITSKLR